MAAGGAFGATIAVERRDALVIAAGGIADGRGLAAALALGACGVQEIGRASCRERVSSPV